MLGVGRPRTKIKDLPLGVYAIKGRYYVVPVNAEMRRIFAVAFPGKCCAPLGADKAEARKLWVKLFTTDIPDNAADAGTVGELIERYEREIIPTLHPRTGEDHKSYCKNLKSAFATRRYAKSEAESSTGPFLRSMDVTRYLRAEATRQVFAKDGRLIADGRPVAANKEIRCLSRVFRLAKTLWGYTEYNPCLQVEYNSETPRGAYHTDDAFMKVYEKASPILQCMMDLAQMHAARRGMLLKATLSCITGDGLLLPINKRKKTEAQRYQLIRWTDELREVINRWLVLRKKVRGGQKEVEDLASAPLFLNRHGKAVSETGFNSMWQRAARAAGFGKHEFHFHDIKAKSVSDSPDEIDAMNRGGHTDLRTTRRVYRRKPIEVIPLPAVSKKKAS
jgi:integrase